MIEILSPHRAKGRINLPATAGSFRAGDPISEPGHITPRFPQGISNNDLAVAEVEIQRETASCWFHMNLRMFDRTKGGPWFSRLDEDGNLPPNSGGYGVGRYIPPLHTSISVLTAEFGNVLPEPLLAELAAELPFMWEWVDPDPRPDPPDQDLIPAVLAELQRLREQVAVLQSLRGGIGHNGPPADDGEAFEPSAAIQDLQDEVKASQPDKAAIWKKWQRIAVCIGVPTAFMLHGAADKMSSEMWEHAHAALSAWETAHHVGGLIARITGFL